MEPETQTRVPRTEREMPEKVRQSQTRQQKTSHTAELALLAIRNGTPPEKLPPKCLLELAEYLGNSAMTSLVKGQSQPPETADFQFPADADTTPTSVPDLPLLLARPTDLTVQSMHGIGFDPAELCT